MGSGSLCKAIGCRNVNSGGVPFFRFPMDTNKRNKWCGILRIAQETINHHSSICEAHFDKDSVSSSAHRHRLKRDALPKCGVKLVMVQDGATSSTEAEIVVQDAIMAPTPTRKSGRVERFQLTKPLLPLLLSDCSMDVYGCLVQCTICNQEFSTTPHTNLQQSQQNLKNKVRLHKTFARTFNLSIDKKSSNASSSESVSSYQFCQNCMVELESLDNSYVQLQIVSQQFENIRRALITFMVDSYLNNKAQNDEAWNSFITQEHDPKQKLCTTWEIKLERDKLEHDLAKNTNIRQESTIINKSVQELQQNLACNLNCNPQNASFTRNQSTSSAKAGEIVADWQN